MLPSTPPSPLDARAAAPACDACPHPTADHDRIGLRFCSATREGALTRGCACRTA